MQGRNYIGGATGLRLERVSSGLAVTYLFVKASIVLQRVNGGVVFCDADAFRELGGYDEDRRYAEDVDFFRRMRHLGKRR